MDMDSWLQLIEIGLETPFESLRVKYKPDQILVVLSGFQGRFDETRVAHQEIRCRDAPSLFLPVADKNRRQ